MYRVYDKVNKNEAGDGVTPVKIQASANNPLISNRPIDERALVKSPPTKNET